MPSPAGLVIEAECTTCGCLGDEVTDGIATVRFALAHAAGTGHVVILNGTTGPAACRWPDRRRSHRRPAEVLPSILVSTWSPGREDASAVYDPANNLMILFGGDLPTGTWLNGVWVLSHANGQGGTPNAPVSRIIYLCSSARKTILFESPPYRSFVGLEIPFPSNTSASVNPGVCTFLSLKDLWEA